MSDSTPRLWIAPLLGMVALLLLWHAPGALEEPAAVTTLSCSQDDAADMRLVYQMGQDSLTEMEELLEERPQAKTRVMVKHRFSDKHTGKSECLWVEVSSIEEDAFEGFLLNRPAFLTKMHAGDLVTARREAVVDWAVYVEDEPARGNLSLCYRAHVEENPQARQAVASDPNMCNWALDYLEERSQELEQVLSSEPALTV